MQKIPLRAPHAHEIYEEKKLRILALKSKGKQKYYESHAKIVTFSDMEK